MGGDRRRPAHQHRRDAPDEQGFEISASFTGGTRPTYSAQVYNDGQLVGAIGGLPPTARINLAGFTFCDTLSELCRLTIEFENDAS